MKKFLSLALVLVLVLSMAVTASATTNTFDNRPGKTPGQNPDVAPDSWKDSQDVKITVSATVEPVYYVTVDWVDMTFTYTIGDREWAPESHKYNNNSAGWDKTEIANAVKVTNHSNAAVAIGFSAEPILDTGVAVTATAAGNTTLGAADKIDGNKDTTIGACKCEHVEATVGISGNPSDTYINSTNLTIAKVNVTISKAS